MHMSNSQKRSGLRIKVEADEEKIMDAFCVSSAFGEMVFICGAMSSVRSSADA